jgi:hypothetical protein
MENNSKISSLHSKFLTALTNSYLILISLFIIFGRSLSGINIFSFRLAELIVGFLVIFSLILAIVQPKNIRNFIGFQYQFKCFLLLLTLFLISLYTNQGNLLDVYSYRSSSYIWTISIIFFSFTLLNNSDTKKYHKYIFSISLPITYFFSTIHYPKIFMNFFLNFSDTWDFVKASDILLAFTLANTSNYLLFKNKFNSFFYFCISSAVLLPLFLYMSKGSFFPTVVFIMMFLIIYFKTIRLEKLKSLLVVLLSVVLFILSTYEVWGNLNFEKGQIVLQQEDSFLKLDTLGRGLSDIADQKDTVDVFASLYIAKYSGYNRLYSTDMMLDWRLQIWQDVTRDLFWYSEYYENPINYKLIRNELSERNYKYLTGFGYNEMFSAMNHWERQGNDGSNENIHNYFFNVLGRGGILQLLTICIFIITMMIDIKDKKLRNIFIITLVPVYLTSFFDASMESLRFPFVLYSGIVILFKLREDSFSNSELE